MFLLHNVGVNVHTHRVRSADIRCDLCRYLQTGELVNRQTKWRRAKKNASQTSEELVMPVAASIEVGPMDLVQ